MHALILETSSDFGLILLANKGVPIASCRLEGGAALSKHLGAETKKLLDAHAFHPSFIAVGTGPGSYTGIRVGAAFAQSLGFGWQVPVLSFCSLKAFTPPHVQGPFAILVDARSTGIYTLFGKRQQESLTFSEPQLLSPTDPSLQNIPYLASPHPDRIAARGSFLGQWIETRPEPALLAQICALPPDGKIPPFTFTYLTSP